jgi:hypothetical protein
MRNWIHHCKPITFALFIAVHASPCTALPSTETPPFYAIDAYDVRDRWLPQLPLDKKECENLPTFHPIDEESLTLDILARAQTIRMLNHCEQPYHQEREQLWSTLENYRLKFPKHPGLYALRVHYWIAIGDTDMAKLDMIRLFYLDNERQWQEIVGLAWHLDSYYKGILTREKTSPEH